MTLFLGVDGGQSSTSAILGDETGRVIGTGRGGPCNHVQGPGGREKFVNAITGCVTQACASAGISANRLEFASACFGFSGGPADKEALIDELFALGRRSVTTDAWIALTGATAGGPGIITIAGTGSITLGRNAAGRTARAGGWGYIFGDEGGGFDLTRQALRAALRMEEGWGPPTSLHARLLTATGAASADALLHSFYTTDFPRPSIAALSKLVDEAAAEGDAVARELLHEAARQLAAYTAAVRRQLFAGGESAIIAYIGGVFRSPLLLARFRTLVELEDENHVIAPRYGPAAGALIEAYRLAGLAPQLTNLTEGEK